MFDSGMFDRKGIEVDDGGGYDPGIGGRLRAYISIDHMLIATIYNCDKHT